VLSNTDIAELLAREAESASGILSRAFRRAARSAFLWPEEVANVIAQDRSLNELRAIGPFIERQIRQWMLVVLRSIEMNLNRRGEGDLSPESLSALDLVLGSFHSSLRIVEDQKECYLAALRNPHLQILGHPRGRIYNFRLGLRADRSRVFAEATELDKALEIDC
jgi:DNA polymerase (family X)